jgi:hypothetical protein|tara:strand:- start:6089 stop:8287 length:2199 start_codon:yes stop_codon:yes gene_type:complete
MPEKNPEVKLSEELLTEYASIRTKWARQAMEDSEFRSGMQWTKEQVNALRKRAQEPLVVNVIYPAVEQAKAMLTANSPRFQSTGREGSDVKTGQIFSDLMSWVWENSKGNTELKEAIDDYYVKGMGCMVVYHDPQADFGKGDVFVKAIDPLDVYIDPSSQDPYSRDASNIIVSRLYSEAQLISMYPGMEETIRKATEVTVAPQTESLRHGLEDQVVSKEEINAQRILSKEDREIEVIERYSKIKVPHYRVFDPQLNDEKILNIEEYQEYSQKIGYKVYNQKDQRVVTDDNEVETYKEIEKEFGTVFHLAINPVTQEQVMMQGEETPSAIEGSTTIIEQKTFAELMETGDLLVNEIELTRIKQVVSAGGQLLFVNGLPIEDYPLVTIMNNHNRNPYPLSDVRMVKGLQSYINKIRSLIVAHASSSTNVKLLIPRGSMNKKQLEEEWGRAGTAVIEFDPELGQPIVAGPIPLPNELYKNEADAKADIERILGIYALMQGDPSAMPQTYKGTLAIDEYGQRRIKSKRDDIEEGINQLAKLVVQLIQATYTSMKVLRLLQPNHKPKEVTINEPVYDNISGQFLGKLNDVTVGKYDVLVVSGSTLPSNRYARFEYYMELYKSGIIDQTEVLKQTDVANVEDVINRSSQIAQLSRQVEGQSKQIKDLQGDLQTARRELVHARQRVEVEKFKADLEQSSNRADMASKLYAARTDDELKKVKNVVAEQEATNDEIVPLEE